MRISDWSSDVCSSDLEQGRRLVALQDILLIDRRSFEARSARGARDGHLFVRCAYLGALRRQRPVGLVRGLERLLTRIGPPRAGQEQQRRPAEKGHSWLHASIILSFCGGAIASLPKT